MPSIRFVGMVALVGWAAPMPAIAQQATPSSPYPSATSAHETTSSSSLQVPSSLQSAPSSLQTAPSSLQPQTARGEADRSPSLRPYELADLSQHIMHDCGLQSWQFAVSQSANYDPQVRFSPTISPEQQKCISAHSAVFQKAFMERLALVRKHKSAGSPSDEHRLDQSEMIYGTGSLYADTMSKMDKKKTP